jgi:23S rRNA pseudouridine1911/1915/1917 synthase
VRKEYLAAVEGDVTPDEGVWTDWLRKLPAEARSEVVEAGVAGAKQAVLRYRCMGKRADCTLLEIHPETGRMHQIRIQAGSRGWPVRGDVLYGAKLPFGPSAELPRDRMIALHAQKLTFLHPIRYEPITLVAPVPETWQDIGTH